MAEKPELKKRATVIDNFRIGDSGVNLPVVMSEKTQNVVTYNFAMNDYTEHGRIISWDDVVDRVSSMLRASEGKVRDLRFTDDNGNVIEITVQQNEVPPI